MHRIVKYTQPMPILHNDHRIDNIKLGGSVDKPELSLGHNTDKLQQKSLDDLALNNSNYT